MIQCSVVTILKFLILEAGPTFSFCTTHCKLYSHPGRQDDARDLTLRTQMPSSQAGQGEVTTAAPFQHTHHHPHTRPTSEINKSRAMAVPHVYTGSMPGRHPPRSSPLTPQQPWKWHHLVLLHDEELLPRNQVPCPEVQRLCVVDVKCSGTARRPMQPGQERPP